jgi:hypothetical protein
VDFESFIQPGAVPPPDLAVITSFYNPCGYRRPLENWQLFNRYMAAQGVALFTIELSFDGEYQLPAGERMVRVRSDAVLWHKERCLNVLAAQIPEEYRYIAWIDCDFFFEKSDWHRQLVATLRRFKVAQLFSEYSHTDQLGRIEFTRPGCAATRTISNPPGAAWGARRELFDEFGLYDRLLTGGGDCIAAAGFMGDFTHPFLARQRMVTAHALPWMAKVAKWTGGSVGYVNTAAFHRWHGDRANRGYVIREALLDHFDPAKDIRANNDGCWEWATDKPDLHQGFREYFLARKEDGV